MAFAIIAKEKERQISLTVHGSLDFNALTNINLHSVISITAVTGEHFNIKILNIGWIITLKKISFCGLVMVAMTGNGSMYDEMKNQLKCYLSEIFGVNRNGSINITL